MRFCSMRSADTLVRMRAFARKRSQPEYIDDKSNLLPPQAAVRTRVSALRSFLRNKITLSRPHICIGLALDRESDVAKLTSFVRFGSRVIAEDVLIREFR